MVVVRAIFVLGLILVAVQGRQHIGKAKLQGKNNFGPVSSFLKGVNEDLGPHILEGLGGDERSWIFKCNDKSMTMGGVDLALRVYGLEKPENFHLDSSDMSMAADRAFDASWFSSEWEKYKRVMTTRSSPGAANIGILHGVLVEVDSEGECATEIHSTATGAKSLIAPGSNLYVYEIQTFLAHIQSNKCSSSALRGILMPFYPRSLLAIFEEEGVESVHPSLRYQWVQQALAGLAYLHDEVEMIHSSLSLEDLFITDTGELIISGLSCAAFKDQDPEIPKHCLSYGSYGPELGRIERVPWGASDMYQLGKVLALLYFDSEEVKTLPGHAELGPMNLPDRLKALSKLYQPGTGGTEIDKRTGKISLQKYKNNIVLCHDVLESLFGEGRGNFERELIWSMMRCDGVRTAASTASLLMGDDYRRPSPLLAQPKLCDPTDFFQGSVEWINVQGQQFTKELTLGDYPSRPYLIIEPSSSNECPTPDDNDESTQAKQSSASRSLECQTIQVPLIPMLRSCYPSEGNICATPHAYVRKNLLSSDEDVEELDEDDDGDDDDDDDDENLYCLNVKTPGTRVLKLCQTSQSRRDHILADINRAVSCSALNSLKDEPKLHEFAVEQADRAEEFFEERNNVHELDLFVDSNGNKIIVPDETPEDEEPVTDDENATDDEEDSEGDHQAEFQKGLSTEVNNLKHKLKQVKHQQHRNNSDSSSSSSEIDEDLVRQVVASLHTKKITSSKKTAAKSTVSNNLKHSKNTKNAKTTALEKENGDETSEEEVEAKVRSIIDSLSEERPAKGHSNSLKQLLDSRDDDDEESEAQEEDQNQSIVDSYVSQHSGSETGGLNSQEEAREKQIKQEFAHQSEATLDVLAGL